MEQNFNFNETENKLQEYELKQNKINQLNHNLTIQIDAIINRIQKWEVAE